MISGSCHCEAIQFEIDEALGAYLQMGFKF